MGIFETVLVLAAFLCSLVAGLLLTFAIVVMPGLGRLDDAAFLRAFKAIDGIIQRNQPVFMAVWVGSALALLGASILGLAVDGSARMLLIATAAAYLFGVQVPTIAINLPLNNAVQRLDLAGIDAGAAQRARASFETKWNRWNIVRTIVACLVSVSLLLMVLRT